MIKTIIKTLPVILVLILSSCASTPSEEPEKVVRKSEPNLKEASELNVQLGVGYIQRKQYQPARDKLEKAIEQDGENLQAYKTLAYLYALLGLNEEADDKYQEALDIKPDDPDLQNSYGAFLCSIDKFEEAQTYLKKAYSNPFYDSIYLAESNAGSCLLEQGEMKQAEALLRKSLRVQPKLAGSLISMAEIGVKTDRYLMARAYIQRYHDVKAPSAASLFLQVQAERELGATDHYLKYARQLITEFPDSDEAGLVEQQARNDRLR